MPQEFEYFAILTNKGTEKLAQYLQSGEKLTISWVVVGDGNGSIPMPDPGRTALVHEVWRGPAQVTGDLVNKNVIKATSVIPTDVGGWNVREIGLIDQDGELFAIANAPGYPKISIADGINNDMCVGMRVAVSNQAGINIKVDGTVIIATIQDIEECIQRHENNLHAHPHFTEPVPHVSENDRKYWSGFANTGPMTTEDTDFVITPALNITSELFSLTVKTPKAFVEGDTITVNEISYTLYQGSDPASDDAFNAGEVITLNFDTVSRRCWASSGGTGTPKPLPPQISNLKGTVPEGETPQIIWTWTNPVDENFAGMVLVVKEGSSPNGPTDGVQVYKGSSTTVTQSEGLQFERTYYARGFAYNSQGKYQMNAEGATATVELSAVPEQVSDVVLTPNKSHATLTWTNPVSTNLQTIKVIQKIGSDPENPNDGTQVYEGTGTTVTVDNLQDSIEYYFAVFAIGKNGKYKDPVVKNYTPEIWPRYDFTGDHQLIKDDASLGNWRVKMTSSGVFENRGTEDLVVDLFIVGGGGGGGFSIAGAGGGGGYTKTVKKITLKVGSRISVEIGAGGAPSDYFAGSGHAQGKQGGQTKFGEHSVSGGTGGQTSSSGTPTGYGAGGNGGSGGGGAGYSRGGNGGIDGNSGGNAVVSDGTGGTGGTGQGSTTREFGEPGGEVYANGGPGGAFNGSSGSSNSGAGYGMGGRGSKRNESAGAGRSGIAIIRNAREDA